MKIYSIPLLTYLTCFLVSCGQKGSIRRFTVESPDRRVRVTLTWRGSSHGWSGTGPSVSCLDYSMSLRTDGGPVELIAPSQLGLVRRDGDFAAQLKFHSLEKTGPVEEVYVMAAGKRSLCRVRYNEMILNFRNADSARFQVVFRVFDDGAAFRYRFPDTTGEKKSILREFTEFRIPLRGKTFLHAYQPPGSVRPASARGIGAVEMDARGESGWSLPALFGLEDGKAWMLLAESDLDGDGCESHLEGDARRGLYCIRFPDDREARESVLPWSLPWRVIIAGTEIGSIVESTLVTDVGRPTVLAETGWIRPGRVSGSRFSYADGVPNSIDLAGSMGWEYALADAGRDRVNPSAVQRLVQAAADRNVGILIRYDIGGPQPEDGLTNPDGRRKEFAWLGENGVKGIRVDFNPEDGRHALALARDIIEDAAEHRLMVDVHGCNLPGGWFRTYPHLMASEALPVAEVCSDDRARAAERLRNRTILPFTRNAVHSMDFAPETFPKGPQACGPTKGNGLALSVVFESGLQQFAGLPGGILSLPQAAKEFLRRVPASWDDIRFLGGVPGSKVVLARKKGDAWFIAGINGENRKTDAEFKLDFLESRSYSVRVINDNANGDGWVDWSMKATAADSMRIPMRAFGGFVLVAAPEQI